MSIDTFEDVDVSHIYGFFPELPLCCFQQSLPCTPAQRSRAFAVLSAIEQQRACRFVFDIDRERFAVGRYLARSAAAALYRCAPAAVPLNIEPGGRPALQGGPHLSISHAGNRVIVAFCEVAPVGIDVETTGGSERAGLAAQVLDVREQALHFNMASSARPEFLDWVWTRKEAVLKALGEGFARDPRSIGVLDARVELAGSRGAAQVRSRREPGYHYAAAMLCA